MGDELHQDSIVLPLDSGKENLKPMNVRELIEALQGLPEEQMSLEVMSEGCDCWGDVVGVIESTGVILLQRSDDG